MGGCAGLYFSKFAKDELHCLTLVASLSSPLSLLMASLSSASAAVARAVLGASSVRPALSPMVGIASSFLIPSLLFAFSGFQTLLIARSSWFRKTFLRMLRTWCLVIEHSSL
ncbi:hypothetical protein L873DRAFT_357704 [Choiromyces venosus 120613-1]|uniref:Uncharacterized protein n=1 Tax=Choiromyces venosus 120613-1 TaxID=1336337 RepID=A0A3N4IXM7_9PEZI|nr:hypothetical protein L873DRAFT_357704 [Choiromyces venosus 120613-1]